MRYHCLACDYDGTLAKDGRVDEPTLAALERFLSTGRKLVLVTGRELDDIVKIFPEIRFFELVVAENGAVLYRPATKEEKLLGPKPPHKFVQALRQQGVQPLGLGRVIVATWLPHLTTVVDTIQNLGLELQVIFNKGAVMVLPAGVNKASGLKTALKELGLSPHEAIGIGDAENDHAMLALSEAAIAVANALPALKERADWITRGDHGAGVVELIDELVANDLQMLDTRLTRHHLALGVRDDGREVTISPYGYNLMIAGPSGSGKSTAAAGIIEQLAERHYQFCLVNPEGDYETLENAIVLGNSQRGPTVDEVIGILKNPEENVVANLIGLPLADRPPFFLTLLPRLQELRAHTRRPHWVIVDEAHHLLPASWEPGNAALPQGLSCLAFITVHPDQVAPLALAAVDKVLAVGASPQKTLELFCKPLNKLAPTVPPVTLEQGEVLFWRRHARQVPVRIRLNPPKIERIRHSRKYAEGELPPDRSFYFQGPDGKLNLRAQNLFLFLQIAAGVDEATWLFHLRKGDYSRWFRERIKNQTLANEAAAIEGQTNLTAAESLARITQSVERYYTLPASAPLPMPGTDAAPTRNTGGNGNGKHNGNGHGKHNGNGNGKHTSKLVKTHE